MGFDVDWTHGADHMWTSHQVSVGEATEALADLDAQLFDPDPKSRSGNSARVLGYSPTAATVLVVILVHREDRPSARWGQTGGSPAAPIGARTEKGTSHEHRREVARRADRGRGRRHPR